MAKKKNGQYSKEEVHKLEIQESKEPLRVDGNFHKMMDEVSKHRLIKVNVALAAEEYACIFGANKNLYRVVPSMQDGLRPGKRRMLYSWWNALKRPTKFSDIKEKSKKVNDIMSSSTVIHPHGDTAIYETIVNEGQIFRNNATLIRRQGNYGNVSGQEAGAPRYIEMYMTEYLFDCFFDGFKDYCIPMKETYNGEDIEPEYFPAKYPHALFNPQFSGIGYGLASNIPPFNVTEVLEACIKLIKNPKAKIMLIPDFKNGCDVIDTGEFKTINETGEGKVMVQASYTIDPIQNIIRITSLPLNVFVKPWIEKVVPLCQKGGPLDKKIIDIRNNSTEGDVKLTLVLAKDANPDDVMDYLLKKTSLRMTHSINLRMIDDYKDFTYGVKSYLKTWLMFRRDSIRYMFNSKLVKTLEREHMLDVLLMVFNGKNAEETLKINRTAKNRADANKKLMERYKITSLQANTITEMHMYQFNEDTYERFKDEKKKLKQDEKTIMEIISDDKALDDVIITQLKRGIEKYGHERRSRVISLESDENLAPDTKHLVGISKSGYIKKIKEKKNSIMGQVGKDNRNVTILEIGNRDSLLVVSADGTISKIQMSSIPDMKEEDIGVEIKRYFSGEGDIITILKCPTEKDMIRMADVEFLMITKFGYAKRTPYKDILLKNGKAQSLINLNEGDSLAKVVMVTDPSLDVVVCTTLGNGIRLPIEGIKQIAKTGKGARVIQMNVEEDVADLCIINPSIKHLLYITSAGKMKLTELRYFPQMEKKQSSIQLITLDSTERLIGVVSANKHDLVQLYGRKGGNNYDPIEVSQIPVRSRVSKGERIVKTPRGETIIGFKLFQEIR